MPEILEAVPELRAAVVRTLGIVRLESYFPGRVDGQPPAPGVVRVSVAFAGVNMADALRICGKYQEKDRLPFVPGVECSGFVSAVGVGVSDSRLTPGTPVLALCPTNGSFATEVDVPAGLVFPVPAGFGPRGSAAALARAASVPVACGTAWLAWTLCDVRAVQGQNRWVLVTGASGGTGVAAVLIAKSLGYNVIATARGAEKVRFCKTRLQADHVLDISDADRRKMLSKSVRDICSQGVDAAFDTVGGDLLQECIRSTRWAGRVAIVGFASGSIPNIPANILLVKGISVVGVYFGGDVKRRPSESRKLFSDMLRFVESRDIRLPVCECVRLEQVDQAIARITAGQAQGKILIACNPLLKSVDMKNVTDSGVNVFARSSL
jgi:NADPH:quinone reductase